MLTTLTVQNFAIIDNLMIDFSEGFTVLTGETGAGKSIIIDAIGLLLGDRASTSMIRVGAKKAIVEGVFAGCDEKITSILDEFGIEVADNEIIIRREISENGKSTIRINGILSTLSQLEAITKHLADIHTQEDNKKLFDTLNYVELIDDESSLAILESYKIALGNYKAALKEYNRLKNVSSNELDKQDYLKYRLKELDNANLKFGEIDQLEYEATSLNNYDNIFKNLSLIKTTFDENNIVESLYNVKNYLEKLASYDDKYNNYLEVLNDCYFNLDDLSQEMANKLNHLEYDEKRLDEINARIGVIQSLLFKYHMNLEDLIEYRESLRKDIEQFEAYDYYLEKAEKEVISSHQELVHVAKALTTKRFNNAHSLTESIRETLKDLYLEKVQLEIVFQDANYQDPFEGSAFKNNGADTINIMISFNVGEPMKELSKVASGGEMSRVMLAIKTHLIKNLSLSTMIFDEIDTGISGDVAQAVAMKMKKISQNTQVLSITHLPIVAAAADHHFYISKNLKDDRTITSIKELDQNERVKCIAKMLSATASEEVSATLASEMVNNYKNIKL